MTTDAENTPFLADAKAQELVIGELRDTLKKSEGWWVLLMAPSCLIKVSNVVGSCAQSILGRTREGYGEAVAESLAPLGNSNLGFCRGLVFRILRIHPELRKEVLKALLKERLDYVTLLDQDLYKTLVD